MKNKLFLIVILAFMLASCKQNQDSKSHDEHEDEKIQLTTYSPDFELFAEADAFVVGQTSNVLAHFSKLPSFKALESGSVSIRLIVNEKEITQTLKNPTRKGIYSFDIKPETAGNGYLLFDISIKEKTFQVIVQNVPVFLTEEDADEDAHKSGVSETNTSVFTKEQSWKIDFSTEYPKKEPFGQVIKTTAQVQSAPGDEIIVSAKTNGIVILSENTIQEGKEVSRGEGLFSISGSELADNNISVRYAEAKNNFEKAESDYLRVKELAKDKIVSEKDLLSSKNQYDNAKAIYFNLNKNFTLTGQRVVSPMKGFIKQIFVSNGSYVSAGQQIITISQNKTLILSADVQQKYVSVLGTIQSANIRTIDDKQTYTLEQLNGRVLSFGKTTNNDNYLIPVKLQIDNKGRFTPGGFVEIYLNTITNTEALTVPNTALTEEQGIYFVYVQVTPERFEKREVKVGATDGLKTEITEGIRSDERIVYKGAMMIKLAQATGTLDAHSGHVH